MINKELRVLIVDDSEDDALLLIRNLKNAGYQVLHKRVEAAEAMRSALQEQTWDTIICDYVMPGFSAPEALKVLKESGLDLPFIVMSGIMGEETAVDMMKAGAHDYIRKDNPVRLVPAIERELKDACTRHEQKLGKEERIKLKEQLEQMHRMEAVGQLAGGIAHDFNNILTAIIGYGHILRNRMKEDASVVYVDDILAAAERAANLTKSLLAFSRKQVMNPLPVNMNEVIKELEKLLRRVIGEDINLRTIPSDHDLTVLADRGQLEQVLINLCANARDAMPHGGELTIETDIFVVDNNSITEQLFEKTGLYARISVSDTGSGIDKEITQKIFEPFFTTKEVGKGTGLGLSIVFGIVKQHHGNINVYSEPGKGTTFRLYFPLIEPKTESAELEGLAVPDRGSETVLVIEDDSEVRKLVKVFLDEFGYNVLEAEDGDDAVRVMGENSQKISLVLLDVVMPKKNGREVYEEMNKIWPGMKYIFMSGYTKDIVSQKGIIETGMDFISKPLVPYDLLRKIREVLDRGKT